MSGLTELSQRLTRLEEISGIMTAMKSLALVETRKLARFMGHQQRMLANIEEALADFLSFHPIAPPHHGQPAILVLVGAERGFCGNFNERVLAALDTMPASTPEPRLVLLGTRLAEKLGPRANVAAALEGATFNEDVPAVLERLMDTLRAAGGPSGGATLMSLAHAQEGEPVLRSLLPFPPAQAPRHPNPPRLQLPLATLFAGLLDQYLLAALTGLLYASLVAENRQRLAHMDQALDRLDQTTSRLAQRRNRLRQEKIVEEIEVILSSGAALQHVSE